MTPDLAVSHDAWLEAGGCAECAGTGWCAEDQALVACTCDPVRRAALGIDPDPAPILRGVAAAWRLVAELPTFPWLRPILPIEELEQKLGLLVEEHDRVMAYYGSANIRWRVRIVRRGHEWEAAWEAAWGHDYDAAWDSDYTNASKKAYIAAYEAAKGAGRDAAMEAIRIVIQKDAGDAIGEVMSASLGEHSWDAAWDMANYIAKDALHLVSGFEQSSNPWSPLVEIGRLGCVPMLQGQEAVIYVPEGAR